MALKAEDLDLRIASFENSTWDELHKPRPPAPEGTPLWNGATVADIEDPRERMYIVSLKDEKDLDSFYDDMESVTAGGFLPSRNVECAVRQPGCVNTRYYLTREEAMEIRKDPRVYACELPDVHWGMKPDFHGYQYSAAWSKATAYGSNTSDMKNWGLLRSTNRQQIAGWGDNATANQIAQIVTTSTGLHTDVVVNDANPSLSAFGHPEFYSNPDGTGIYRQNQYNWFQLTPQVSGGAPGNYDYSANQNSHAVHTSGTCAGNTQGWARDASVYNITFIGNDPRGVSMGEASFSYTRVFHQNKTVNPLTGHKNPTIQNNSWGGSVQGYNGYAAFPQITYRAVTYNRPGTGWTLAGLLTIGQTVAVSGASLLAYGGGWSPAVVAAANQMMAAGVIMVASAGNNYSVIFPFDDTGVGVQEWQSAWWLSASSIYPYAWGTYPASAFSGTFGASNFVPAISVGSIGPDSSDRKDYYSNTGPQGALCFAPGTAIMSSFPNETSPFYGPAVPDPRNSSYYLNKNIGTSMAGPQVTGIAACIMETYPEYTQRDIYLYMLRNNLAQVPIYSPIYPSVTYTEIGNYQTTSFYNIRGGQNNYLTYYQERVATGNPWPRSRYNLRPTSGRVYPRQNQRTYRIA